jgi:hypothetical protein
MRAYYRRVAERYLSSEGELKSLKKDSALERINSVPSQEYA